MMKESKMKKFTNACRNATMTGCVALALAMPVFAEEEEGNDVTDILNNLVDLLFDIIRLVGVIGLIWGVVTFAMSITGHDPSQRIQGTITIAASLLLIFVKSILTAIGVPV